MLCCVGANATGYAGSASTALLVNTFRPAGFDILIQRSVSSRHDLRQEPYAVTPLVRICAGGGQQWPSLPRPRQLHRAYKLTFALAISGSGLVNLPCAELMYRAPK
jgi:hypothetical protein